MEQVFADYDASLVALAIAAAMLIAWRAGLLMGLRLRRKTGEARTSNFDDASLALISLLLAFTFSMSIGKHDQRRLMVIADSNAIGDFYTCASLLKEPVRTKLHTVIRDYAELRLRIVGTRPDSAEFERALQRTRFMQAQMTEVVGEALEQGTPIAVSLTNALNGVTSNHAARLAAATDRLLVSIVALLLLSAVVATMLVGREQGASDKSEIAGTLCFIVLVTFAIYVTLDLNQPTRGLITVRQESMRQLLAAMSK